MSLVLTEPYGLITSDKGDGNGKKYLPGLPDIRAFRTSYLQFVIVDWSLPATLMSNGIPVDGIHEEDNVFDLFTSNNVQPSVMK